MTNINFRSLGFAVVIGFSFQFATAQDRPRRGTIGNIFEQIFSSKGGPFSGSLSGSAAQSISTAQSQKMAACKKMGARCSAEDRLGCEKVEASIFGGVVQCWNNKVFRLKDNSNGTEIIWRGFEKVERIAPDQNLVLAKTSTGYVLLSEDGKFLADSEALGCTTFEPAEDGMVTCVRGTERFSLSTSDLENAREASVKLKDISDDIAVNLCSIAEFQVKEETKVATFGSAFVSTKRVFEVASKEPITIKFHEQARNDVGSYCSIPPSDKRCRSVFLTSEGLECNNYGAGEILKPMKMSKEDLNNVAKQYLFQKEIVKLDDVLTMAMWSPNYIRVNRPDLLLGSTDFITSKKTGKGSSKGVN